MYGHNTIHIVKATLKVVGDRTSKVDGHVLEFKSQEVASRLFMMVHPVEQGCAINRAGPWADKSHYRQKIWFWAHALHGEHR